MNKAHPALVLGSSSPYRKQQLKQLGLVFESFSPDIDETPRPGESAKCVSTRLANAKAEAVLPHFPESLIIGSDQCASFNSNIIGKPGSHKAAFHQLRQAAGKTATFYTSVSLMGQNYAQTRTVETQVKFRELTDDQIDQYLRDDQPYNCAGSFKCEQLGIALFQSITSDDPTALIGLPLISLTAMLAQVGLDPLG